MGFTQLDTRWVKTRKPHKCYGCRREWPKGSKMFVWVCVEDNTGYTPQRTRVCVVCYDFMQIHSNDWDNELPDFVWWDEYDDEYIALEEERFIMPIVIAQVRPARSLVRERREGR